MGGVEILNSGYQKRKADEKFLAVKLPAMMNLLIA